MFIPKAKLSSDLESFIELSTSNVFFFPGKSVPGEDWNSYLGDSLLIFLFAFPPIVKNRPDQKIK